MIYILSLLLPLALGTITPFIENGDIVSPGDPLRYSVARLEHPSGRCSATFLTPITLLTAGHCVHSGPAGDTRVSVRDARGAWHSQVATAVIRHPLYRMQRVTDGYRMRRDFALVKLRAPLPVPVIPVAVGDIARETETFTIRVAGFGKFNAANSSSVMREGRMSATVKVLPQFDGEAGLHMVAANSSGHATCGGDSGGPVLFSNAGREWLVGVHSLSSGCLNDPPADSYSQMPSLVIDWILRNQE